MTWRAIQNLDATKFYTLASPKGSRGTANVGNTRLQAWVTVTSQSVAPSFRFIYCAQENAAPYGLVLFTRENNRYIHIGSRGPSGESQLFREITPDLVNAPIHCVAEVVGGVLKFWVNGALVGTDDFSASTGRYGVPSGDICIGRRPGGTNSLGPDVLVHGVSTANTSSGLSLAQVQSAYLAGAQSDDIVALPGDQHLWSAKLDGSASDTAARPATSLGVGFYVVGGKIYDANGNRFRMRGTNKTHQDNQSLGLGNAGSNATRWILYYVDEPARCVADMASTTIGGSIRNSAIAIPGYWDGTCKDDIGLFTTMINRWVRDASVYQNTVVDGHPFERYMVLNIGNEWGGDHLAWRNAYQGGIAQIRAAGWHGCIMVDAPGCAQDPWAIVSYGQDVLDADPEKNVMFSTHVYGAYYDSGGGVPRTFQAANMDLAPALAALAATGLCVVVGEFGPGRNVGPSPTLIAPERVVALCEANDIGWLSWSWDDNNLLGGMSDDDSFSHSYTGAYASSADLTIFGKFVVEHPTLGWKALAKKASIFGGVGDSGGSDAAPALLTDRVGADSFGRTGAPSYASWGVVASRSAGVQAVGALTATATNATSRSASISASATLSSAGEKIMHASASIAGRASLTAVTADFSQSSCSMGAAAALSATPSVITHRSASIAAVAGMTASPYRRIDGLCTIQAASSLVSSGQIRRPILPPASGGFAPAAEAARRARVRPPLSARTPHSGQFVGSVDNSPPPVAPPSIATGSASVRARAFLSAAPTFSAPAEGAALTTRVGLVSLTDRAGNPLTSRRP